MADIVTLTINPAIDISTTVSRVEPIRKLRCSAAQRDPGGGGINVARVIRRFGGDVAAIYPTGGAIGELLRRLVEHEGIKSYVIPVKGETREDFTAFEEISGKQYRFILPGPRLSEEEQRSCLDTLNAVEPRPRFIVASGSLPPGVSEDFYGRVAMSAKQIGAKAIIDTSGAALRVALNEGGYLIKPNLHELSDLIAAPLDDEKARIQASRSLVSAGKAEVIALTLGHEGALLMTRDNAWRAEPMRIKTVSAVGAGDSFLGAMVWALASGYNMEDAFRYGVAAGSAALLTPGTELCRREDVERLLPAVKIQQI